MLDTSSTFVSVTDGRQTATAGTRAALAASATPCRLVKIKAFADNTSAVVVGGSAVVAALASRKGYELAPNESVDIRIDDASKLYLDTLVTGEGVCYVALA